MQQGGRGWCARSASVREIDVSTLFLNDTSTAVGDAYTLVNGIHRVTAKIVGFAPGNGVGICMSPATLAAVTLITMLTLLIIAVSSLGVLNTVALQIRERAHDIGIFKALGMTSGQTLTTVICSVSITGLVAVPAGVLMHHGVLPAMAHAANSGPAGLAALRLLGAVNGDPPPPSARSESRATIRVAGPGQPIG